MPAEAAPAAGAASADIGSIGIVGAPSDTLTEDAILGDEGAAPAVADAPPAEPGKTGDAGALPAEGAEAAGKTEDAAAAAAADAVPGTIPPEVTALFKNPAIAASPELKAAMPKIQSAFNQLQAIREVFPNVRSVLDFRDAFPGGLEEAKAAAQKATVLDAADDEFKGTPDSQRALAGEWHDDDPDAFASMFVQSAGVLAEKNPQAYERVTEQVFQDRLEAAGFTEQIEAFRQALAIADQAEQAQRLRGLTAWMVQEADKRGIKWKQETGKVDPTIAAAQRERQAATTELNAAFSERVELFRGQANASIHTTMTQSVAQVTAPLLKDTAFSDAGKAKIREEIMLSMDAAVRADRTIQRQFDQIVKNAFKTKAVPVSEAKKQVTTLITNRAKALVAQTSKEVIEEWTARLVQSNTDTNARRAAAGARQDVGAGGATPQVRTRKLTPKDTEGMTDEQIMDA